MNSDNFYLYAIVCHKESRIYVGISQNVERRIQEHNSGKVSSTKYYAPWVLFYKEVAGKATEARKLEKHYKSAAGKRKLHKILKSLNSGSLPD
ncbi:MAG TPA: GIY-YIG nuclease family protein [Bacteroidales bacterium]|nr:GIY-YIG nuclease family protein [Bacteroidales bacterium]